eukprot:9443139-Pyramimonas_sp.AAC.1
MGPRTAPLGSRSRGTVSSAIVCCPSSPQDRNWGEDQQHCLPTLNCIRCRCRRGRCHSRRELPAPQRPLSVLDIVRCWSAGLSVCTTSLGRPRSKGLRRRNS